MEKTRIIKGKPIYIHKCSQYVYQPDKTIIRVMKYDSDKKVTFIYCVRPTLIPELIMTCILILFALFNILVNMKTEVVHYNEEAVYYNGLLYLNMKSEDTNYYEIGYGLLDSSGNNITGGTLKPGDLVTIVPISNTENYYTMEFKYNTLLGEKRKVVKITVLNKDEKSVDGVYENE